MPWNGKSRDFPATRSAVYEHVLAHVDAPIFDFIMVDEGQDLDAETFEVLDTIAAHVTVCADNKQQIYEDGSEDYEIIEGLGLMKANNTLLEAFRCSPYIVDLAAELVDIPDEATALVNQARTSNEGRETPLLYVASDFEDERENLIDIVRTRSMRGENVAILLPKNKQVYGFAKGLSEAGLDVELSLRRPKKGSSDKQLDFNSDRPKLMTYHSAKGLTFDTVILPRLDAGSFNNLTDERVQKLLFVGVTRATQWVYMSGTSGKLVDAVEDMIGLSEKGKITVRRYGEVPIKPAPSSTVDIGDDLDDLL